MKLVLSNRSLSCLLVISSVLLAPAVSAHSESEGALHPGGELLFAPFGAPAEASALQVWHDGEAVHVRARVDERGWMLVALDQDVRRVLDMPAGRMTFEMYVGALASGAPGVAPSPVTFARMLPMAGHVHADDGLVQPIAGDAFPVVTGLVEGGRFMEVRIPKEAIGVGLPDGVVREVVVTTSPYPTPPSFFINERPHELASYRVYFGAPGEGAADFARIARALDEGARSSAGAYAAAAVSLLSLVVVALLARRGELAPPGTGDSPALAALGEAVFPTRRSGRVRARLASLAVLALFVVPGLVPGAAAQYLPGPVPPPAVGPGNSCAPGQPVRHYNVTAIDIPIIYNRFGDVDPLGEMYVRSEDVEAIHAERLRLERAVVEGTGFPTGDDDSLFTPLVLRAGLGECLEINFTNGLSLEPPFVAPNPAEVAAHLGLAHPTVGDVSEVEAPAAVLPPVVPRRASIHVHGLPLDPMGSEGSATGYNPDSTVPIGANVTYRINAAYEGVFYFHDHADASAFGGMSLRALGSDFLGSNTRGLFGAVVVEPRGARWTHPHTGEDVVTGWRADILLPANRSYREFVVFYHDPQVQGGNGLPIAEPMTEHGLNYRVETMSHRIFDDDDRCPDYDGVSNHGINPCQDPSLVYSSFVHGDPGTPILRAYLHEKVKIHLVHAGMEESHSHHLHNHRWRAVDGNERSTIIDSQLLSPGETWTQELNLGAGGEGVAKGPGDSIFHCHLFPHLYGGMWGILRVHDAREPNLRPLADSGHPPPPRAPDNLGFGGMVVKAYLLENGLDLSEFNETIESERSLTSVLHTRAPAGNDSRVSGRRPPLPPQEAGLDARTGVAAPAAGAPYTDPCPAGAPERSYHLKAIEAPIRFNARGDHSDVGKIYAFAADAAAIQNGTVNPDPVVLRTARGECLNILLENHFPEPEGDIRVGLTGTKVSIHSHLYAFDVLGSDGLTTGWSFDQGVWPGESIRYRFYSDEDLQTVVWHDHTAGLQGVLGGEVGATLVEPAGAQWRDPTDGGPVYTQSVVGSGVYDSLFDPTMGRYSRAWRADVWGPGTPAFREFFLTVQDTMPLGNLTGVPLRPNPAPPFPFADFGMMGFNYRSEPLHHRTAYGLDRVFDSTLHGDPSTPLLEAYPGDRTVIRVHHVPFEEVHAFTLQGHRWQYGWNDTRSNLVDTFTLSVSEAFNAYLEGGAGGPLKVPGDYLYRSSPVDDVYPGAWGIFRVHAAPTPNLLPLPGSPAPSARPTVVDPCPAKAPVKTFDVVAIQKEIVYNAHGDHDMGGMLYVLASDAEKVRRGEKEPEPLTLRVEEGTCVKVRLLNDLPDRPFSNPHAMPMYTAGTALYNLSALSTRELLATPHASLPQVGNRTGIFARLLLQDVRDSGGVLVGRNPDSTIGPGETKTYTFYADTERIGLALFEDMADPLHHKMHGLFGGISVIPKGARVVDPSTGVLGSTSPIADVLLRNGSGWRDVALYPQNGLALTSPDGYPVPQREDARIQVVDEAGAARRALYYVTQVLGTDADFRSRIDLVRPIEGGWVVRTVTDGWHLRVDIDSETGDLRHLEASRDAREVGEGGYFRLLDGSGAPLAGKGVRLLRAGAVVATATTDASGVAVFPGLAHRGALLRVHVNGTGADFTVRTDSEGRFQLVVHSEWRDLATAERAAEDAAEALASAHLPASRLGVRSVDVSGGLWRVGLEDALRRYDVELEDRSGHLRALAFESRAVLFGQPSFLDDSVLVSAATGYVHEHFGDTDARVLEFSRDRHGAWRVELAAGDWTSTMRYDGTTGRLLSYLRVRTDGAPETLLSGASDTSLRLRREDGASMFGTLVQTFHEGELTGSAVALGDGRTPVDPLLLRAAYRPSEVTLVVPGYDLQFPWDVSPNVTAYTPIDGLATESRITAALALGIAQAHLASHVPPDAILPGGLLADGSAPSAGSSRFPLGLRFLALRADGWHAGFGNARHVIEITVDATSGDITNLAAWSALVRDAESCLGEPVEHSGPHRPPACPWAFTVLDEEEQGQKAFNYRAEPFEWRTFRHSDMAYVFSSWVHGDPATPLIRAYAGDPVRIQLASAGVKGRAESFMLSGHVWPQQPHDAASPLRQAEGGVMPGRAFRLDLVGGAGGPLRLVGDYLYQGAVQRHVTEGGMWGILRVLGDRAPGLRALTDRPFEPSRGGGDDGPGPGTPPARCDGKLLATVKRTLTRGADSEWRLGATPDGVLRAPKDGRGSVLLRVEAAGTAPFELSLAAAAWPGWNVTVSALPVTDPRVREYCLAIERDDTPRPLGLDLSVAVRGRGGILEGTMTATLPFHRASPGDEVSVRTPATPVPHAVLGVTAFLGVALAAAGATAAALYFRRSRR